MKNLKKLFSLILCFSIISTIIFVPNVYAADFSGKCGNNVSWTFDMFSGILKIKGTGDMYSYTQKDTVWKNEASQIWEEVPITLLRHVEIDEGVTSIGDFAFGRLPYLETVTMEDSVVSIGKWAFNNCEKLSQIDMSKNINSISGFAFSGCKSLTKVNISDLSSWCKINREDNQSSPVYSSKGNLYINGDLVSDLTIPDNVTEIKSEAFNGFSNISKVTIPSSVEKIGMRAFAACSSLNTVNLSEGLKKIEFGAFSWGESLKEIRIPKSVISIAEKAFLKADGSKIHLYVYPNSVGLKYAQDNSYSYTLIQNKNITDVSLDNATYTYDGTEKSLAVTGNLLSGAKVEYTNEKATNAGTYNATAKITCDGYNDLTLKATLKINPAEISVKADDVQMVKGDEIPKLKYTITSGKLFGNDKITGELKVNTDGKTVGDFDITQGTLAVSSNYKLTFEKGKLSVVDKTPQNIIVSEITEKTYGDADFKVEVTKDPVSNLDTFTYESSNPNVAEISADGTVTIKAAGETDITVKQAGDDTYAPFEKTQKLVVKKVSVTVTAEAKSKKIGAADPELTYTYTGTLIGNDEFTGKLERQAGEEVGQYDILIGTLAINDNYDITYNKAIFEIFDKTPQNITVADFGEKTYGDNSFKVEVTKDPVSNLDTFTYESSNPDVAEISADGTVTIKGAGETDITVYQAGNDEYAPFKKSVKLVVKKKAVTVTSVDIENKTAVLDGVLAEDAENVMLDFDKITIEQGEAVDETTVNVTLKGFSLKGDKAANYEVTTESLAAVMANGKIVSVEITAENGTVTGAAKYIKGSSVTVTATANSGYKFKGWYTDNAMVSTESAYTFTADTDISLTAKFEKEYTGGTGKSSSSTGSCTIKLDTNGGNSLKNISVKKGQKIGTIETPKKDGYVFDGWYSDKALTKPYNSDETVTASKTLYASWKIDPARQLTLTIGDKNATVFGEKKANDVAPIIRNDRTMLPARFVAENLGAKVEWDEEKQLVTITGKSLDGKEITILITIGSKTAKINDEETELDSEAFIENDRTYTPVRFIAESLGASVEWNENTQEVIITK